MTLRARGKELLKGWLYRGLGDRRYALLRVPGYLVRLRRAVHQLRRGLPVSYETPEFKFLSRLLPELRLFVDVGAYLGDYAIPIALAQPRATVVALEPVPSTYAALQTLTTLLQARNVELHNVAAGEERGTAEIAIQLMNGAPSPMGASMSESFGRDQARATFSIAVRPLDDVLQGRRPDLIKIDVEGFEETALRGMSASLAHHPAILCELWHAPGEHRARRDRVFAWLGERGYAPHLLDDNGAPIAATAEKLEALQRTHSLYSNYVFLPRQGKAST